MEGGTLNPISARFSIIEIPSVPITLQINRTLKETGAPKKDIGI